MPEPLTARLQMLLVVRWLDEGSPADGAVPLSLPDAARELGLGDERRVLLQVMSALGDLEDSGDLRVAWTHGRATAAVTLSERLRRDVGMFT